MEERKLKAVDAKAVDTITEKPVLIHVDIQPANRLHKWLQNRKIMPSQRTFILKPLTLGTLLRVSKVLLKIDTHTFNSETFLDSSYKLMAQHSRRVAHILALAVTNSRAHPDKSLIRFFLYNLKPDELMALLTLVLQAMRINSFMNGLILARGLNLIAAQKKESESPETFGSLSEAS